MQFLPPPIWMMFWKSSKRPFVHNVQWHSTQCSRQQALSQQLLQSSATPNDIFTFYSVFMAGKRKCPEQSSCISFFSFFILYFPFSSPSSPFYGWKCQGRRSNCRRLHSLTTKWDNGCRRSNKTWMIVMIIMIVMIVMMITQATHQDPGNNAGEREAGPWEHHCQASTHCDTQSALVMVVNHHLWCWW